MKGSLQLLSWLDQSVIDTVSNCKVWSFNMRIMYHMLGSSNMLKNVRWKSDWPLMRNCDKFTFGELSKLHVAGPWKKPLIVIAVRGLTAVDHHFPGSASVRFTPISNVTRSVVICEQRWSNRTCLTWHCMNSSCFFVTIFLFHSQALMAGRQCLVWSGFPCIP